MDVSGIVGHGALFCDDSFCKRYGTKGMDQQALDQVVELTRAATTAAVSTGQRFISEWS